MTATVNVELGTGVVVDVGVPVISPVAEFKLRPVGSEPAEIVQAKGEVPSLTVKTWSYGVPRLPFGSEAVEMANVRAAASIEMLSAVVADAGGVAESVTFIVKLEVPAAVGVPVMAPVLASKASPAGRLCIN